MCHEGPAARVTLLRARGQALVNAGRGADAAEVFIEAAAAAQKREALELERCAAEQLLNTGPRVLENGRDQPMPDALVAALADRDE